MSTFEGGGSPPGNFAVSQSAADLLVAIEVASMMNHVLSVEVTHSEWTTAHIVSIPKKPGTTN